jgi:23S rRNA (cytidine1920-2'-O)/16S rRNA (cytidine1409-2'-O)-methyltransferase
MNSSTHHPEYTSEINPEIQPAEKKRPQKQRLDQLLLARDMADSLAHARSLIMAGKILVNEQKIDKPGTLLYPDDTQLRCLAKTLPYVSRGGLKLAHALQTFNIALQGLICLDVGASTGGFTDCMLQNGAAHVYAMDVGHNQLDYKLRQDPRVTALEKTNIRHVTPAQFDTPPQFASIDVSFISLKVVLPAVCKLLPSCDKSPGQLIALLKPQFEYRDYFPEEGFDGVVTDPDAHVLIQQKIADFIHSELPALRLLGCVPSPILGPKGNQEFLLHLQQIT